MKKFLLVALTVCLSLGVSGNAFANAPEEEIVEGHVEVIEESIAPDFVPSENEFGLSTEAPVISDFVVFGVNRPSSVWNISSKGTYNFSGSTNGQTLYSNYKFKGKTSYTVKVINTGSNPITVKAKRLTKTYASTKVSGGKSASFQFSNIQSATEFYLTFEGSGIKFEGTIK